MTTTYRIILGILIFLILLAMGLRACAEPLPPDLLKAIHKVETSGRFGPILGDNGKALGPFQIHREYWKASGVSGRYEQCADYDYSVKVVTAYMNRFAPTYVRARNKEAIARIHNGGPKGYKKTSTVAYWKKVKKALDKMASL